MKSDRSIIQTHDAPANAYPERPVPGVYPVIITDVQDVPGSHLKIWYDFVDLPFKGYFSRLRAEHPDWDWLGMYCRYYTPAALWAFDKFCNSVSRSNGNYVFDGEKVNADEKTLIGKKMGLVIRGKEYYTNSGNLSIKLDVVKEVPLDRIPYESVPEVLTIQSRKSSKLVGPPARPPARARLLPRRQTLSLHRFPLLRHSHSSPHISRPSSRLWPALCRSRLGPLTRCLLHEIGDSNQ